MRNPVHGSPLTWPQRNQRGKERDIGLTWHLTLTQLSPGKENSSTMGPCLGCHSANALAQQVWKSWDTRQISEPRKRTSKANN